ncbi:probable 28S ribosomal protein S16, mitochondrial [Cimex lectularius]|uniref:Small ribosomal subunit protein bS16m n=1 Tax=Cimex lectularius TaxID=79782 RepID=A0A8I6TG89_CIMLE|nr:probable 28S ribosomal protein S16, mitochondrial [Cimex lectularius]
MTAPATAFMLPSSGGGQCIKYAAKAIRLARRGCTNRPFYHIVVMMKRRNQHDQPIEQLGSFDPMPNTNGEKLVAFNFERIGYWIGEGAEISTPVAELLGLSGFLSLHPTTLMTAWRNRKQNLEKKEDSPS